MIDVKYKTLSKRINTNHAGIYYREIEKTIIDNKGNIKKSIVDKIFIIRYKGIDEKWKSKNIGKYSEGIRIEYCKRKRIELLNSIHLGEQPYLLKEKKAKKSITLNEVFEKFKKDS